MQRILAIWCLGLLGGCGASQPSMPKAPPPRAAPVARAEPPHVSVPKPAHAVPLALEPDQPKAEDAMLCKAISLYEQFIDRARSDPAYAEAVRRSRERISDIRTILEFRAEGRHERARDCGTE